MPFADTAPIAEIIAGSLPLLARHGQGNGRRSLAVIDMRLVHRNKRRGHDRHAENGIHDFQDARLQADAVIVLLQLANSQEDHLVIDHLADIVWIGDGIHRRPGIGVHQHGLRPMFFKRIAPGPQLNGGIHGSTPVVG
jgi:hypothetical protein